MYAKFKKSRWLLALSAALLAVLLAATTAFAEGEEPPEAPAAEEPAAPVEETPVEEPPAEIAPAEETAVEDPPTEETAPEVETTPAPEEAAVEALPAEEIAPEAAPEADASAVEPLAEIAAEAAESGVVLVDESGGELPLTETSSAALLSSGDPYYKIGLTQYSFYADPGMCGGAPNCFDNQGTDVIQDALDYMATTGLPSNRMLYVQGGTYDGFTIDGTSHTTMALFNGVIGEVGSENTHINGNIIVQNNLGGFTLSGFSVDTYGSINFAYNSGTLKLTDVTVENSGDFDALKITDHAGAVVLDGVNVSHNDHDGAYIDTSKGSYPITIKNSAFNDNGWFDTSNPNRGLFAWSNSTITIDGVSASGNNGDGIDIDDYATLTLKNAFLSGNNSTITGWGYALYSYTDGSGSANLENVYAYGNDSGLYLQGGSLNAKYIEVGDTAKDHGLYFYSKVGSSRVEYGQFHGNLLDGLHIENKGAIYLNSIQSSDNIYGAGAYLDNAYGTYDEFTGSGAVTITSPASGGWQLANGFFNNGDNGVTIFSRGSVLISNADMGDNDSIGLFVDNSKGLGSVTLNTTISNWGNGFWNNGNGGIQVDSQGTVKLSNTGAEWNGGNGINVYTFGNIELLNVTSANNDSTGAILDNHDATLPRTVTLTNTNFNHNNGDGLLVLSRGSITAYGLSANGNSIRNLHMGGATTVVTYYDLLGDFWVEDSYTFNIGTSGQWVDLYLESDAFDAYLELYDSNGNLVTSDDDGWYDSHAYIGISLTAIGDYTVVVKSFNNNGSGEYLFSLNDPGHSYIPGSSSSYGVYLDNSAGSGSVSINKPKDLNQMWGNTFNLNTYRGLEVISNGTITLDSAAAENNFNTGVYFDNPTSRASVLVSNSRTDDFYSGFSGNGNFGVYIETRGNVMLKNIGAWDNDNTGVYVDNCQYDSGSGTYLGFGSVKVLALGDRSNDFSRNYGYGLGIWSKGAILLTNINAENNQDNGVHAFNHFSGSSSSVTLTTSGTNGWNRFYGNDGFGLETGSYGAIVLSNLEAYENTADGFYLDNHYSPNSAGITITRGYFYDNEQNGLEAFSKGAISWRYGDAWENGLAGAWLRNTDGSAGISILGSSKERMNFGGNGWDHIPGYGGLVVYSNGKITLGYALAESNNGDGFLLYNYASATNQMVDVTEVEARWNIWAGLNVASKGAISVKGIRSEGNDRDGAYLYNDSTSAISAVTVTTSATWTVNDIWSNDSNGLIITSRGSVTLKNISARENGWDGINVDNAGGTGNVTFLTTGKQFWLSDNGSSGLYINSNGNVTLTNQYGLNVHNNHGDSGVYIDNNGTLTTSTVSLTNVFANDNHNGNGIEIYTKGRVTAVSLIAQNNASDGLYITSNTGSVTLSGSNTFTDNAGSGMTVEAPGAISISNVRAWANGNEGIYVYAFSANITLYNVIAAHNQYSGIYLKGSGNYNLNKVTSFMNGQADLGNLNDDGLAINTGSATSTITILNSTFMNNWWGSGIEILHPNPAFWPTLTNVSYLSNGETNLWVH